MKETIDIMRGTRKFLVNITDGISIQKLNEIPEGFNNNLAWNIGHISSIQQIFCYRNAGVKPILEDTFIDKYKSGTRPDGFIEEKEFKILIEYLNETIDRFEKDSATNMFENYKAFDLKSYPGVRVKNINDAAKFLNFHDGLHVGYSMALKRLLKK